MTKKVDIDEKTRQILKKHYDKQTAIMKETMAEVKKEVFKACKKNFDKIGSKEFNEIVKLAVLKKVAKYMRQSIKDGVKKAQEIRELQNNG